MEFVCRVGTPDGRVVDEVHQAQDERTLRNELEKQGYHLFELRRRGLLANVRALVSRGEGQKISMRSLLIFNQELAALLRSGLPMLQSLELMLEPAAGAVLSLGVERCRRPGQKRRGAVAGDRELWRSFPTTLRSDVEGGERSGDMELVLPTVRPSSEALAGHPAPGGLGSCLPSGPGGAVNRSHLGHDRLRAAQVYRLLLVSRCRAAPIDPHHHGFFTLHEEQSSFHCRGGCSGGGGGKPVGAVTDRSCRDGAFQAQNPSARSHFHRMALSELCRSLSTLLAGGIPLVESLEVAIRAVGNDYIRARLAPMVDGVREGKSLAETLEKSGVGFEIAIDMVKVGEATGSLDAMLEDASNFLDEEVETRLERVLSLLEPVMMMLMGIIVATLLVSVYLPIFSLLGNVNF